jgi:hypothetical protein
MVSGSTAWRVRAVALVMFRTREVKAPVGKDEESVRWIVVKTMELWMGTRKSSMINIIISVSHCEI